jgi:predicted esterase
MPLTASPLTRRPGRTLALSVALAVLVSAGVTIGDELLLKNGTVIEGAVEEVQSMKRNVPAAKPDQIVSYPILQVTTDLARYFVGRGMVQNVTPGAELKTDELFRLEQPAKGAALSMASPGVQKSVTPFDQFGRRTLELSGAKQPVIQGIVEISPTVAKLKSLRDMKWETAIATSSIPLPELDAILRKATRPDDPDQRLGIARFYMLAQHYGPAERELVAIREQFTELAPTVDLVKRQLRQLQADQILGELKLRRQAGQHQLVSSLLARFPREGATATTLAQVDELDAEYKTFLATRQQLEVTLGELESQVEDKTLRAAAAPYRQEIIERLHPNSSLRLQAFRQQAQDAALPAPDRLALAISGWMVGSEHAVNDLRLALRIGEARALVLEYLRSPDSDLVERTRILQALELLDGIGAERIAQLVPLLPPPLAEPPLCQVFHRPLVAAGETDAASTRGYTVALPPEYSVDRRYPLILCLHAQGGTPVQELQFWAGTPEQPGQSQRYGAIVVSPDFARAGQADPDYLAQTHQFLLDVLVDVRKRFAVDSDRVFLVGHGMGASTALDFSYAHPDLFAGVVSICGVSDKQCRQTWENVRGLPLYLIDGELNGSGPELNARELDRFFKGKEFDVLYCEYRGAGFGGFYDEILRVFSWINSRQRRPAPRDFIYNSLRETDRHAWWLGFSGLQTAVVNNQSRPQVMEGHISAGNTIRIQCRAKRVQVRLSPDLVNLEERVRVQLNTTQKWNDFVTPDVANMLEDLRRRGDTTRLTWALLEF